MPQPTQLRETGTIGAVRELEWLRHSRRLVALRVLISFIMTFIAARVVVYLIISRTIPDLFLYIGGTHVHHFNHGIFLLAGVGAYLIFRNPSEAHRAACATIYGIGLGLTFDEFGMWFHMGGGYWQQASFDAVVVIASLFVAIVLAPSLKRFRPRHWATTVAVSLAVVVFVVMFVRLWNTADVVLRPRLDRLESQTPP